MTGDAVTVLGTIVSAATADAVPLDKDRWRIAGIPFGMYPSRGASSIAGVAPLDKYRTGGATFPFRISHRHSGKNAHMNIGSDNSGHAVRRVCLGSIIISTFMLSLPNSVGRIGNEGWFDEPFVGKLKVFNAPFPRGSGQDGSRHDGYHLVRMGKREVSTSKAKASMSIAGHPITVAIAFPNPGS